MNEFQNENKPIEAGAPLGTGPATSAIRLTSLDAFRGLVMFLMLAEVLRLFKLINYFPDATWLEWVKFHTTHVAWAGCSLHDLIQPGFSFLVGAALPFSLTRRQQSGQSTWWLYAHAAWRSLLLIALGIFVRSLNSPATNFTFEDTLTQIGLGYFLLFVIARGPNWLAPTAIGVILVGYWAAFAANPPAEDFDYQAVGVPLEWTEHQTGFASAWNKNSNLAWKMDTWFLNLFPRPEPFLFNRGGYSTLNFVPTLATMLMGLLAGRCLLNEPSTLRRLGLLAACVAIGLMSGWLLDKFGICPLVKPIWTPSFALWSGGWCFLFVLVFHLICDVWQLKSWSFPLVVVGCNCILVYLLRKTIEGSMISALHRHLGTGIFEFCGPAFTELFTGLAVLTIFWLLLFWMYRNKILVKL